MKQLRKDIVKELLKYYKAIQNYIKVTEAKVLEKNPTAEEAVGFTLLKAKELNEKLSEIMDKYQEKFDKIEELIEYFESNEDE